MVHNGRYNGRVNDGEWLKNANEFFAKADIDGEYLIGINDEPDDFVIEEVLL